MEKEVQLRYDEMLKIAKEYMKRAYAPYSNVHVGSAVLSENGKIFGGCNIENASYGLTNCAERVALQRMVSEGEKSFKAILIISDREDLLYPCGACRQVMAEFAGKNDPYVIVVREKDEKLEIYTLSALIPYAVKKEDVTGTTKSE